MAQTIEEYFVTLGLKVDKAQEQRFNSALDNLGKTFAALAAGLTAAAATIQATVVAVSKSFDNLYFAAQRTNSTVAGIKALSYAFSQIGSSGSEAQASIEGLSKAMRTNPGTAKWLNSQGIATEGRKTEAILSDIFEKFGKMPQHLGYQFAEVVGVSEEVFNKASKQWPDVLKYIKEYQETAKKFGINDNRAGDQSNEVMTKARSLLMTMDALFTKVTVSLQPQLNQLMADIAKWFEEHQEQVVRVLNQILEAVKGLIDDFGALLKALEPVADKFAEMVELLTGEKNSLKVALEVILAFMVGKWLTGMLGAFTTLAAHPVVATLMALTAGGTLAYLSMTQPLEERQAVSDSIDNSSMGQRVLGWMGRNVWGPLGVKNKWTGGGGSGDATTPPRAGLAPVKTKDGRVAWVDKKYQAQFQGFVNDLEATGYQIKDIGGFADRANVNNPSQKSKHAYGMAIDINPAANPNRSTKTDLPPSTGALAEKWGLGWGMNWKSTKDPMHFSTAPNEGGRQMSPDELKALQDEQASRLKDKQSELFGAPAMGASSARLASISNRTSITVYGSSDPAGTAANLNGAQSRVASELIRNGQSAFV